MQRTIHQTPYKLSKIFLLLFVVLIATRLEPPLTIYDTTQRSGISWWPARNCSGSAQGQASKRLFCVQCCSTCLEVVVGGGRSVRSTSTAIRTPRWDPSSHRNIRRTIHQTPTVSTSSTENHTKESLLSSTRSNSNPSMEGKH